MGSDKPVALNFSRLAHPFYIRPNTSDMSVALNNFVREEYGALVPAGRPRVMVDAGAYIGDTSAYFLSRFPGLRSIAIEPMTESLAIARLNLSPYGDRVELRACALTSDGLPVQMTGLQTGACISGFGSSEIPSITLPQILAELPEGRIDILKMDIEGAEGPIFASAAETWLDRVGLIIVETHGAEITQIVLRNLEVNGWIARRVRNLYFCIREKHDFGGRRCRVECFWDKWRI